MVLIEINGLPISKIVVPLAVFSALSARCYVFCLLLSVSVSLRLLLSAFVLVCEAHVFVLLDVLILFRSLFVVLYWFRVPVLFLRSVFLFLFRQDVEQVWTFLRCVFSSSITTVCSLSELGVAAKYRCHGTPVLEFISIRFAECWRGLPKKLRKVRKDVK